MGAPDCFRRVVQQLAAELSTGTGTDAVSGSGVMNGPDRIMSELVRRMFPGEITVVAAGRLFYFYFHFESTLTSSMCGKEVRREFDHVRLFFVLVDVHTVAYHALEHIEELDAPQRIEDLGL